MPKPGIQIFKDLEELSRAAAREFVDLAGQRLDAGKTFGAALSGGSTPKRFYQLLATAEFRVAWDRVHLFQVDERCVSPDSPQSNFQMMREALLERVAPPGPAFHRMAAEQPDREAAAEAYGRDLGEAMGTADSDWPRLDLICLGMGADGHTASLFPGTTALEETHRAVCPNYVEKLNMWRITLTRPVLNAAARVIFLVSGTPKAQMLRQVLNDSPASQPFPAQLIQPVHGTVAWYVDQAAAALL